MLLKKNGRKFCLDERKFFGGKEITKRLEYTNGKTVYKNVIFKREHIRVKASAILFSYFPVIWRGIYKKIRK